MVKMLKIDRILCPVDFSDFSDRAYDYAQSLARHYDSKLFVQHVVPLIALDYPYLSFSDAWTELYNAVNAGAQQKLQELVKSRSWAGVPAEMVVAEGSPAKGILEFASTKKVEMVVMGTHGRQGLDRLTMGSVTEKVLRKAPCPVLVVSKPEHGFVTGPGDEDPVHLRKILFCMDFSEHSDRALQYALSLAMEYEAELTLLHVLENAADAAQGPTPSLMHQIEGSIPPEAHDWCTIKTVVRTGKPYHEITQLAREAPMELIVMGVRGRNVLDLTLFGSTTHRVIQSGVSPVLVCSLPA